MWRREREIVERGGQRKEGGERLFFGLGFLGEEVFVLFFFFLLKKCVLVFASGALFFLRERRKIK